MPVQTIAPLVQPALWATELVVATGIDFVAVLVVRSLGVVEVVNCVNEVAAATCDVLTALILFADTVPQDPVSPAPYKPFTAEAPAA